MFLGFHYMTALFRSHYNSNLLALFYDTSQKREGTDIVSIRLTVEIQKNKRATNIFVTMTAHVCCFYTCVSNVKRKTGEVTPTWIDVWKSIARPVESSSSGHSNLPTLVYILTLN